MALGFAPSPAARGRRSLRPAALALGVVAVVALAVVAVFELSGVTLTRDSSALAHVSIQPLGGKLRQLRAKDPEGRPIELAEMDGRLTPVKKIAPGTKVTIVVTTRRPGWNAWLVGKTGRRRLTVMAPLATVTSKWVTKPAGAPVPVTFSEPIARVAYAGRMARGTGTSLGLPEKARAGTVDVAVAARAWEKLGDPATVHYFPPAKRPVALVSPAPGGRLDPGDQLRLTFSTPPGKAVPKANVPGHWKRPDAHTLVFTASGAGPSLGSQVKVTLPHTLAIADTTGAA